MKEIVAAHRPGHVVHFFRAGWILHLYGRLNRENDRAPFRSPEGGIELVAGYMTVHRGFRWSL